MSPRRRASPGPVVAEQGRRDDRDAQAYWEAVRWQSDHVERGRSLSQPPTDPLTVITPDRIVHTEHWLRRSGYAPRQTWQR